MLANPLALTTMERSFNLLVVFHIGNIAYLLNFRALASSHGLDEAPVVLLLGPDHLGEGGRVNCWLSHGHFALPTQFQLSSTSPLPRKDTCGPPTWP